MKTVNKSYKYRIYPNKEQEDILLFNMGCARFVFNHVKAMYEIYIKQAANYGFKPLYANRKLFNNILKDLKKYYPFLKKANSTVLQKSYDNLIFAYRMVGKAGHGWVKFKSRKNPLQSFRTLNIKIIDGKLKLPKIKTLMPMRYSRKVLGDILTATITRNNSNQYFVSINVKNSPVKGLKKTGQKIGIDLGLKDLATFSNGFKTGKIHLKEVDQKIRRQQQILSKKVENGCNYVKAKTKLNRLYQKKKNIINDFLHKKTTQIVQGYDEIYVGNVNNQLGLKNKYLAKTTVDQHWFEFKRQLKYKSEWYRKYFGVVDEKYTSKTCSNCGYVTTSLDLNIRQWNCPSCNTLHDRDVNAACNILTVGTTGLAFSKTNKKLVD
ncbi:MAG: RNA-guided endonuclease TnpB family protein [Methanobacteriaceae archaeon]|nr:RNA-guided endonuclease TnpB family protein [Methanobacteriaceae archaeon]